MSAENDRQIRIITGRLGEYTEEVVRRLSIEATANLIEDTPVDTGWARANWVPSIGSPVFSGEDQSSNTVPTRASQQQAAVASLAGYSLNSGPVFISTGVPYMNRLNAGHSGQATSGFVQAAIQRAVTEVGVFNGQ